MNHFLSAGMFAAFLAGAVAPSSSSATECYAPTEKTPEALAAAFDCGRFEEIVELTADNFDAFYIIEFHVASLQRLERFGEALAYLSELRAGSGIAPDVLTRLDNLFAAVRASENRMGVDYWFTQVLADPSNDRANTQLLEAQILAQEWAGAITTLNRALINQPATPQRLKLLVDLSLKAGNEPQARAALARLLELERELEPELLASALELERTLRERTDRLRWGMTLTFGRGRSENPEGSSDFTDELGLSADRSSAAFSNILRLSIDSAYRPDRQNAPTWTVVAGYSELNYERFDTGDSQTYSIVLGYTPNSASWTVNLSDSVTSIDHQRDVQEQSISLIKPLAEFDLRIRGFKQWHESPVIQSGQGHEWTLSRSSSWGSYRFNGSLSGQYYDATDDVFSYEQNSISLGLDKQLSPWIVGVTMGYLVKDYQGSDSVGALFSLSSDSSREDSITSTSIFLTKPAKATNQPTWTLRLSRQDTDSTLRLYSKTTEFAELSTTWRIQ